MPEKSWSKPSTWEINKRKLLNLEISTFFCAREGLVDARRAGEISRNYSLWDVVRKDPARSYQLNLHLWATFMMFRICFQCWTFPFLFFSVGFCFFGRECTGEMRDNRKKLSAPCYDVCAVVRWWKHGATDLSWCFNNSTKIMFFIFHCLLFRDSRSLRQERFAAFTQHFSRRLSETKQRMV